MIDLHCHTNFSDGALTPEELIQRAYKQGLKAIAITDHDTISGIDKAINAAKNFDIEVIAGVEISCYYKNIQTEIHIVGICIDHNCMELLNLLKKLKVFRFNRNKKMIENLLKIGIDIKEEDLLLENKSLDSIGKPNFARLLIKKGLVKNQVDAMKKYLDDKNGLAKTEKEKISIKDAIDIIHKAKGIAILAHPHTLQKEINVYSKFYNFIEKIRELGLDGIEVYYNGYKKEKVRRFKKIAKMLGLLMSGGSDYHNDFFRGSKIGFYGIKKNIPDELIDKMKKYLD